MSSLNTVFFVLSAYVPDLLGLAIALTMLLGMAHKGRDRRLGVIGIVVMLLSTVTRLGLTILQNAMLASETSSNAIGSNLALFSTVHLALNIIGVFGMLLLVYGLCRATKTLPPR